MLQGFKPFAPAAASTLGTALSGCSLAIDWGEVEAIQRVDFDTSGEGPSEVTIAEPDSLVINQGQRLSTTIEGNAEAGNALRFDRDAERLTIVRDTNIFDGSEKAIIRTTVRQARWA